MQRAVAAPKPVRLGVDDEALSLEDAAARLEHHLFVVDDEHPRDCSDSRGHGCGRPGALCPRAEATASTNRAARAVTAG